MSRIHYIHNVEEKYTVGYIIMETSDDATNVEVAVAVARANPKDQFCRSRSRGIIEARLKSEKDGRNKILVTDFSELPTTGQGWMAFDAAIERAALEAIPCAYRTAPLRQPVRESA